MKRLIIIATIAFLVGIGISTATIQDPVLQAFASGDIASQVVRVLLIGLLTSFLFIEPPRSIHFRAFLGVASVALAVGVCTMMFKYIMAPLDAVMYVEVAIIFAIEALELSHGTTKNKQIAAIQQG